MGALAPWGKSQALGSRGIENRASRYGGREWSRSGGAGNFLTRLTTWIAIAFFLTSFALAYVAKQRSEQVAALGMPEIQSSAEVVIPPEIPVSVDSESFDSEIPAVPVE